MKYKNKNIDDILKNKNWEGVQRFTERYSIRLFFMLDKIVSARDFNALKEFVKEFSIEPVLEYGLPVGGEGVKELYDISDKYHSHKNKTGAEWWVRDEIQDIITQLRGHSAETGILDRIAFIWKEVDASIKAEAWLKESAFKKVLVRFLINGIYKAGSIEENSVMREISEIFEKTDFSESLKYDEGYED